MLFCEQELGGGEFGETGGTCRNDDVESVEDTWVEILGGEDSHGDDRGSALL